MVIRLNANPLRLLFVGFTAFKFSFGTGSPTRREASSKEERPGDERGRQPEAFRLLKGSEALGFRLLGFKAFRLLGI